MGEISMKNRKNYLRSRAKKRKIDKCGLHVNGKCPECEEKDLFYYFRYDATCCVSCDTWIDKACNDPDCPYCSIRPSTPSEAFYLELDRKDRARKDWLRKNYQHKHDGALHHERKKELYDKIISDK